MSINQKIKKQPEYDITKLPAVISAIQTQARNTSRASVFIDDEFFGGFRAASLRKLNISKGDELTEDILFKLVEYDGYLNLKDFVLRILSNREHAVHEIRTKAQKKGFSQNLISRVIEEFIESDYINEGRYVKQFVKSKQNNGKWGVLKIRAALLKKRISPSIIDEYLDTSDDAAIVAEIKEYVSKNRKRFSRESDILKRKKKMYSHLTGKGHPTSLILSCLDELADITNT